MAEKLPAPKMSSAEQIAEGKRRARVQMESIPSGELGELMSTVMRMHADSPTMLARMHVGPAVKGRQPTWVQHVDDYKAGVPLSESREQPSYKIPRREPRAERGL